MEESAKAYKQKALEMPKIQEINLLEKHSEYMKSIEALKLKINQKKKQFITSNVEDIEEGLVLKQNGNIDYAKNFSQKVITHGLKTQAKSHTTTKRVEARVEEIKDRGDEMIEEMDRQEDVIIKINDANDVLESHMKRVGRHLKYFARTFLTDKFILLMLLL